MSSLEKPSMWKSIGGLEAKTPLPTPISQSLGGDVSRRRFLQLMGASAALAGVSACTRMPKEKIIPYLIPEEDFIPGEAQYYSTSTSFAGYAKSILVKSHQGHPTKIEGHPQHPSILGKSDIFMQADLLDLYDPDRAKNVLHNGQPSSWDEFCTFISHERSVWENNLGEGVRILAERSASPSLLTEMKLLLKRFPKAKLHIFDPWNFEFTLEATRMALGKKLRPLYNFKKAQTILSLDHDFLAPGPQREKHAKNFMEGKTTSGFNRMYVFEPSVSITGAAADHRWPVGPSALYPLAVEIARSLGIHIPSSVPGMSKTNFPVSGETLQAIAQDLMEHRGRSLVLTGEHHPPEFQALIFAMNERLGNLNQTVEFLDPPESHENLESLVVDIHQGKVTTLFILGGNPVYNSPASLDFKSALHKVEKTVRLSSYHDETSALSHWSLPQSHFLESWGDGTDYEGSVCFVQPLISPLYDTKSPLEVLLLLTANGSPLDALHKKWGRDRFQECLSRGFIESSPKKIRTQMQKEWTPKAPPPVSADGVLEVIFRPDPTLWDGRYANNAWLQELPKPLLQLTWRNAVLMSPELAERERLTDGDEIEISTSDRTLRAPVLRMPGQAPQTLTLFFGYGRSAGGSVGKDRGYSAYDFQNHRTPYSISGVKIKKLGTKILLALTHDHWNMEGRDLVVHSDFETYKINPDKVVKVELKNDPISLIANRSEKNSTPQAWAMTINLTTCIGCSACTMACQAENNIPVVGEEQVLNSREMHWIRVDRYFSGAIENPEIYFQPVPCMQCEEAPCETVCPTAATNHSHDGLNQMIYNRCVGTRFCSNNCPYKVRRFNFLQYSDLKTPEKLKMYNPDVTVRSRGVMEKCTFCVQRIESARIKASNEGISLKDGEIKTACQQACPTNAIVFGDKNDSESLVSKNKKSPLNYSLLNEEGTRPRTTYLARITNPNGRIL